MKNNRTFARKGNKAQKPIRLFEGKINQLKRERVVLCSLVQFEEFKKALGEAHVDYDLGDFYNGGIIVVKK